MNLCRRWEQVFGKALTVVLLVLLLWAVTARLVVSTDAKRSPPGTLGRILSRVFGGIFSRRGRFARFCRHLLQNHVLGELLVALLISENETPISSVPSEVTILCLLVFPQELQKQLGARRFPRRRRT